ncbi:hypothetical protein [Mycolicibacter virginiensis]|uniref:hypothetical protein n=1 Tax=Mycolicibacter virginiensis TaxID=1795032 RepID=UPI001F0432B0|nr:hypothetical protein [Mycolicibacter virginiensis]ULP48022.1 hypothetical protein MJO54_02300 [Mycolicibacter virginiensis]
MTDSVTPAQLRRFVVERLAPAGVTEQQLDAAVAAVLERAPLPSWSFTGHWYTSSEVGVAELQRIVDAAIRG